MRLGISRGWRRGGFGGTLLRGGARGGGVLAAVATRVAWRLLRGGVRVATGGPLRGASRFAARGIVRAGVPAAGWILRRALRAAARFAIGTVLAVGGGAVWVAWENRRRA